MALHVDYTYRMCSNQAGNATFATVWERRVDGWRELGRTRYFRTYPAMSRAGREAERLIARHHASAWPDRTFAIVK